MALDPLTGIMELGGKILDKFIPDPQARIAAQLEFAKLEADLIRGQNETNTAEAANNSTFVAGWRPFIGWVCGCSFAFKYIGGPLLVMVGNTFGVNIDLPDIDSSELMPILFGMLGLGTMRTVEKVATTINTKGV